MRAIIYHINISLDGFIANSDGSTSDFMESGEHVTDYCHQLKDYDTIIMGRNTYESAYCNGQPIHQHMTHYVVSDSLIQEEHHPEIKIVRGKELLTTISELKNEIGPPIYLSGGGQLAKTLLHLRQIDELILTVNPVLLGSGIHLFGGCCSGFNLHQIQRTHYNNEVQVIHYQLDYIKEEVAF